MRTTIVSPSMTRATVARPSLVDEGRCPQPQMSSATPATAIVRTMVILLEC